MGKIAGSISSVLMLALLLVACSNPSTPITYERIVIDTYSPNGSIFGPTHLELFDSNGDPDSGDDFWAGDDAGDVIASDDNSHPTYTDMARIDYTGGLTSGTYYIRVRGDSKTINEFYAIRVLSLTIAESVPVHVNIAFDFKPDSYEDDDDPASNWIPLKYIDIDLGDANALSRSIDNASANPADADVDWFKLVLP